MPIDYDRLRLDGVYKQNEQGQLMLRVKAPAGVLSTEQALKIATISERFSNGMLHLTTRCSVEFHWLSDTDLPQIWRELSSVGLTSRGACGGAVRGIACSTTFSPGFGKAQLAASRFQKHFAGNPRFEGLPKKFKVGVEGSAQGGRHLIQDAGIVYVGESDQGPLFDLWAAGGLGREPMEAFLYERAVPENQLLPLLEALVEVHRENTPKGKRLKHVVQALGQQEVRRLVEQKRQVRPVYEQIEVFEKYFTSKADLTPVEAVVFAGEIRADIFRRLAEVARDHAEGYLALTANQNVALLPGTLTDIAKLEQEVKACGFLSGEAEQDVCFRICPGSHQCRMGLAPTRDVTRSILTALGDRGRKLSFAISGCPNACAQPQLADVGILARKSLKQEDGSRKPLFELQRRSGEGFGVAVATDLEESSLIEAICRIL